jgi:hypothetical protein
LTILSGGIIIGIGLFLLLPSATEHFKDYFKLDEHDKDHGPWEEMPYSYFLAFVAYSFLLFVEKIALSYSISPEHSHDHGHEHGEHKHRATVVRTPDLQQVEVKCDNDDCEDDEEEIIKNVVSSRGRLASFMQKQECKYISLTISK